MVKQCPLIVNGLVTCVDLNVLPLGSDDVLIAMDWLEAHKVKLYYRNKTFRCIDEEGNPRILKRIPNMVSISKIPSLQLNKFFRKGCQLYAAHLLYIV